MLHILTKGALGARAKGGNGCAVNSDGEEWALSHLSDLQAVQLQLQD
jgi:hypothetical protein